MWALALLLSGCQPAADRTESPAPSPADAAIAASLDLGIVSSPDAHQPPAMHAPRARPAHQPTQITSAGRVVAIGDLHGDLQAARGALRIAGAIDAEDHWIGRDLVVVQVGDQLDRGDDERAILHWFEALADEAWAAGGGFYPLLGNHEVMNVDFDFRYVTPGGWLDFSDIDVPPNNALIEALPIDQRGRAAAFHPGGPYATLLAGHNVVMLVDDTLFVHGGLLPSVAEAGIEALNDQVRAWMRGDGPYPEVLTAEDSPVWSRHYSDETDQMDCELLYAVLEHLQAERMVVAHTVFPSINATCGDRVWRIDVGMAAHYGGHTAVLEIFNGRTRVLD
jgi:hypothetical protein